MKILVLAYACEPGKGSEPGVGWAWTRMLAALGETWVLTRENNRDAIEAKLANIPERGRLHFAYVDLPPWARWWKRGSRGVRLYYLLWQWAALRRARGLHRAVGFDLVWHVTMANAWLGSTGGFVGPPFVYGPVGGGVGVPWRLVAELGVRGAAYDALRAAGRGLGRFLNPLARAAWRRADLILVQNPETRRWLPARYFGRVNVFPNAVLEPELLHDRSPGSEGRTAVFASRLLPWKGGSLAIRAIARAPSWALRVLGSGPDERRLRRLVARLGVGDRVRFLGWRSREVVLQELRDADLLLSPSLREEAGLVVAEAIGAGVPVLCLDRGGPPVIGRGAMVTIPADTAEGFVEATAAVLESRRLPAGNAVRGRAQELEIGFRTRRLRKLLSARGLIAEATPPGPRTERVGDAAGGQRE